MSCAPVFVAFLYSSGVNRSQLYSASPGMHEGMSKTASSVGASAIAGVDALSLSSLCEEESVIFLDYIQIGSAPAAIRFNCGSDIA